MNETYDIPVDRTFRGRAVVVPLLFTRHVTEERPSIIEQVIFEDCLLVGPAVIAIIGQWQAYDCEIRGAVPIENVLWPRDPELLAVGCVGFRDCLFERCTFTSIGFAGSPQTMAAIRSASERDPA